MIGDLLNYFCDGDDEPADAPTKNEADENAAGKSWRRPSVHFVVGEVKRVERDFAEQKHEPTKEYCRTPMTTKHSPEW